MKKCIEVVFWNIFGIEEYSNKYYNITLNVIRKKDEGYVVRKKKGKLSIHLVSMISTQKSKNLFSYYILYIEDNFLYISAEGG